MTDLKPLIEERGLKKATIIDDAFDLVPRPDELTAEGWGLFFDDLGDDDLKLVQEIFPDYDATSREDLQTSQPFITVLWNHRDRLSPAVREPLLREYETTNAVERTRLEQLKTELEALGLQCTTSGRESGADIKDVDLVFVDLFLGFFQSDSDMDGAITKAREFVSHRAGSPPLIVLMSNSTRLWEKRNEFRDKAGLLGSTFRVISKADLAKTAALERLLVRLIDHYEDAKRVAAFVDAWDTGLDAARKRFIQSLRCLDLSDFAQIRTLLLEFEGQALGEYLLDVADRVLQHEIEADPNTITAAQGLNKIDLKRYPAPHLAGSSDLQDFVNRMIYQNSERLRLADQDGGPRIEFGDLFQCRDQQTGVLTDSVLLVATPACDLIRACRDNVLVVPGTLSRLGVADWAYGWTTPKTPIFRAADGTRSWIKWDFKGRRTTPAAELLDKAKNERVARLRDVQAIELQQQLLVDMGRIGQIANMPATFPVSIDLFKVCPDERLRPLEWPKLDAPVCFVGRDEHSKRVDHLVVTEDACDAFHDVVAALPIDDVHALARPSLTALKADLDFFEKFERGLIEVPLKPGKLTQQTGLNDLVYLYLVRNEGAADGDQARGNLRNAPLIIKITDVSEA
jgi:hypothetical protein